LVQACMLRNTNPEANMDIYFLVVFMISVLIS